MPASHSTRLLLVEDEPDIAFMYETLLKQAGYDLTLARDGQADAGTAGDGLVTKVSAGACSDATFTTDTNGLVCIDSTNGRIYFRYSGAWHYAAQTAGFQIPSHETEGLAVGNMVIGKLNERLADGRCTVCG